MSIQTLFQDHFARPPTLAARAPGRVNLLGEHVDYNDGVVLPAAIDREVSLAAAPAADGVVSIQAIDLSKSVSFRLSELDQRLDVNREALPSWAHYPAGVAWALQKAGKPVSGMQAAFTSDVPIGAGLQLLGCRGGGFCHCLAPPGWVGCELCGSGGDLPDGGEPVRGCELWVNGPVCQRVRRRRASAVF